MTDYNYTDKWRTIFTDLTDDNGCYYICKINAYQLSSHLEELYLQNQELKERIEVLKKSKTDVYNDLATSMKQAAREVFGNND